MEAAGRQPAGHADRNGAIEVRIGQRFKECNDVAHFTLAHVVHTLEASR